MLTDRCRRRASAPPRTTCCDRIGIVAGDDVPLRHAAQPGQLALRELAGRGRAGLASAGRCGRRRARPRPAGSRPSASTAGRDGGRRARAAPAPRRRSRPSSIAAKRCAMRACSQARSRGSSAISGACSAARRRVWRCEIGAPVTRCTSSARWIRCASRGAMRAAATGSTVASSACSAGQPSCARAVPARRGSPDRRPASRRCRRTAP